MLLGCYWVFTVMLLECNLDSIACFCGFDGVYDDVSVML